jgi:hypothetical protein
MSRPLCTTLALSAAFVFAHSSQAEDWERRPVFGPGVAGNWDEFAVSTPRIVRVDSTWRLYYTGWRIDDDGPTSAIGLATSSDGQLWTRHGDMPVFEAPLGTASTPELDQIELEALCRRTDGGFVMLVRQTDASTGEIQFRLARSKSGLSWELIPLDQVPEPNLHPDDTLSCALRWESSKEGQLHLWALTRRDQDACDLWHSASRGSAGWTEPEVHPIENLGEETVCHSGALAIIGEHCVVALVGSQRQEPDKRFVKFLTSKNRRHWKSHGPPDFTLPQSNVRGDRRISFIIDESGTTLWFDEPQANGATVITGAFCPKSSYRSQP